MTTLEKVVYEVWVEEPNDGRCHLAHFLTSPEVYKDREQAERVAHRYNDEQVGWGVPLPHRRFYTRSAMVVTTKIYVDQE